MCGSAEGSYLDLFSFATCNPFVMSHIVNISPIATTAIMVPQMISVMIIPVSNITPPDLNTAYSQIEIKSSFPG